MKNCQRNPMSPQLSQIASIFFILTIIQIFSRSADSCFNPRNSYGKTSPFGDIVLHVGQPLELFCTIDIDKVKADNFSIDDLLFLKDEERIPPAHVTRVNETTIRLYMENQQESEHMYSCNLQRNLSTNAELTSMTSSDYKSDSDCSVKIFIKFVCMNWVTVGQKPREVTNVTCISLNWEKLNCSWQVPKNYVPTNYKIDYVPNYYRHSERMPCPDASDVEKNFCVWTLRSTPMYRKNFPVLNITITGKNQFGSSEQTLSFDHFAHIVMDGPKDLQLAANNSTSLTLQWDIGDLQYFPKPLMYKIQYKSSDDSKWHTLFGANKDVMQEGRHVWYTISGLTPKTGYNFRVYMKASIASDEYWSEHYAAQFFSTAEETLRSQAYINFSASQKSCTDPYGTQS